MRVRDAVPIIVGGLLTLLLAACGAAGTPTMAPGAAPTAADRAAVPTALPSPVAPIPTVTTTQPAPAAPSALPAAGELLYVYDTAGVEGRVLVLDARTGKVERTLPAGTPNADWTVVYAAEIVGERTTVRAVDAASGAILRSMTLDGRYALPFIPPGGARGGLSRKGRLLVLAQQPSADEAAAFERDNRWISRFALLDPAFGRAPWIVALDGNFSYDTLAPSGDLLYLIEHRPAIHPTEQYAVRAYDIPRGRLRDGAIVDKSSGAQVMEGTPGEQIVMPGGAWVFTLYRNSHHGPFVHALEAANGFAMCIDLPRAGKEDLEAALMWGLTLAPDGQTLYAVNGVLGHVVEIDAGAQRVRRAVVLPPAPTSSSGGPLARLGGWLVPPVAAKRVPYNGAALSPDGRTLYALGASGIVAIDTGTLTVRARLAPDVPFDSVRLSPDGARLYAVSAARGQVQRLDPATGALLGEFSGGGLPWGLLRVEARR